MGGKLRENVRTAGFSLLTFVKWAALAAVVGLFVGGVGTLFSYAIQGATALDVLINDFCGILWCAAHSERHEAGQEAQRPVTHLIKGEAPPLQDRHIGKVKLGGVIRSSIDFHY